MAAIYESNGMASTAHQMFEKALQVNPQDAAALAAWANLLRKEGNFHQAAEFNRRLLGRQPLEPAHYQNLANLLMEMNRPLEAEAALRLACLRIPDDGRSLLSLARFLLYLNKPGEAVAPARSAAQLLRNREAADVWARAQNAADSQAVP